MAAAPCLFDAAFKLTAAFTATLVLAGPRQAAESAHNKTLQFTNPNSVTRVLDTNAIEKVPGAVGDCQASCLAC